ncbi:PIG-L deacetylase family protein [Streptomyces sp. NPDC001667]
MTYKAVFLAPHLDDVVYACGGLLAVTERALVVTLFAGAPDPGQPTGPAAMVKHTKMGVANAAAAITVRRREDEAALALLGAHHLWLEYPDAIYRGDPPRYPSRASYLSGPVHPDDRPLVGAIAAELALLPRTAQWFAPLGVGGHVDHLLAHAAARRTAAAGMSMSYYEDMPYALTRPVVPLSMAPVHHAVGQVWSLRIEAALRYRSQLAGNFGTEAALRRDLEHYARANSPTGEPTERTWHGRHGPDHY